MPTIDNLYDFPAGQPVDPEELDSNFGIVQSAFNDSAARTDVTTTQEFAGPLQAPMIDTGGAFLNLKKFGAVGDATYYNPADQSWYADSAYTVPATNNRQAFANAFAALSAAGGGMLMIPRGSYYIDGGTLPAPGNVRYFGAGMGVCTIRKGSMRDLFDFSNQSDFEISGIAFDGNDTDNFIQIIRLNSSQTTSRNVHIHHCKFFNTQYGNDQLTNGQTMHAVLASYTNGLWLDHNYVQNMQFKLCGGTASARNNFVVDNVFVRPYRYACSFVVAGGIDNVLDNIHFSRNKVYDCIDAGGFYWGEEGSDANANVVISNVFAQDNIISGTWTAGSNSKALNGRPGLVGENWVITGNVLIDSNGTTNSMGIAIGPKDGGGTLDGLVVANNVITGFSWGISIFPDTYTLAVRTYAITGNVIRNTQGIRVEGAASAQVTGGIVSENNLIGGRIRLRNVGYTRVAGNVVDTGSRAGLEFIAGTGETCRANCAFNYVSNSQAESTALQWFAYEDGSGTHTITYFGNEHDDLTETSPIGPVGRPRGLWQWGAAARASLPRETLSSEQANAAITIGAGASMAPIVVTLSGSQPGDQVLASFSGLTSADVLVRGTVTAANTVTVTARNEGASPVTIAAGTFRLMVWGYN